MVRILFCATSFLAIVAQSCWALETDFEDLVLTTAYSPGDSFNSGDLGFDVVDFPDGVSGDDVIVTNGNEANGGGLELNFVRSVGLDFQLPGEVQGISFLFAHFSSLGGLVINGVESAGGGFPSLNGTTLGGVSISVTGEPITGGVRGQIVLDGPIQSFIIGGLDVYIDDVTVTVPEPASMTLALVAGLGVVALRRRRQRVVAAS